jgi:hypothetical protein
MILETNMVSLQVNAPEIFGVMLEQLRENGIKS